MPKNSRKALRESRQFKLSCVVPVHNEAENIVAFVEALEKHILNETDHYEIIIVDDGSEDGTVALVEHKIVSEHVKLIGFSRNFGKENALSAGLEYATGNAVLLIDADFQHPFETIPQFLDAWANGDDMVYGIREHRLGESFLKRYFTKVFYWFMKHLGEIRVPPNAGDFRLMDRCVVDALNHCQERSRFMKGLYAWVGFKTSEVVYPIKERAAGTSSWHFRRLTELALTGIFSFSDAPLRVLSLVGLAISAISFLCALYIIISTMLFGEDVPGYATLLTVVVFFGGVQMLSIGLLGEYVSRIFREVKQRPKYIISKKIGL